MNWKQKIITIISKRKKGNCLFIFILNCSKCNASVCPCIKTEALVHMDICPYQYTIYQVTWTRLPTNNPMYDTPKLPSLYSPITWNPNLTQALCLLLHIHHKHHWRHLQRDYSCQTTNSSCVVLYHQHKFCNFRNLGEYGVSCISFSKLISV